MYNFSVLTIFFTLMINLTAYGAEVERGTYLADDCPASEEVPLTVKSVYIGEELMCSVELIDYSWFELISEKNPSKRDFWFPCKQSGHSYYKGSEIKGVVSYQMRVSCIRCRPGRRYECSALFDF